jgi:hypothetical protein
MVFYVFYFRMELIMHQEIIITVIVIIIVIIGFISQRKQIEELIHNYYSSTNDTCKNMQEYIDNTDNADNPDNGIKRIDTKYISCLSDTSVYEMTALIAKKGHNIPKTITEKNIYYHFPQKWNIKNGWLLKDVVANKYYIPEGFIMIKKGTEYMQLELENDAVINYYMFKQFDN